MCGNSTVNNLKPHVMKKKEEKECLRQQLGSLEEEVSSVQASSLGLWWKPRSSGLKSRWESGQQSQQGRYHADVRLRRGSGSLKDCGIYETWFCFLYFK